MSFTKVCTTLMLASILSLSSTARSDSQQMEHEIMAVLDAFMESFSASDPQAHTATYHFPHYRLARGEMQNWETREDAIQAHEILFQHLPKTGWHQSIWIERRIISTSPTKVHVATRFRRLRKDGTEIVTTESLYVLIKQGDRWGVKLRSSYL